MQTKRIGFLHLGAEPHFVGSIKGSPACQIALQAHAEAIDRAIAHLESLMVPDGSTPSCAQTPKHRGWKSMGEAERQSLPGGLRSVADRYSTERG